MVCYPNVTTSNTGMSVGRSVHDLRDDNGIGIFFFLFLFNVEDEWAKIHVQMKWETWPAAVVSSGRLIGGSLIYSLALSLGQMKLLMNGGVDNGVDS